MRGKGKLLLPAALMLGLTLSLMALADGPPKKIEMKSLENLYAAVQFDHAMHVDATDDCKTCHHKPFGKPMGCAECHDEPVKKGDFSHEKHWEYDDCASCHQVKSTKDLACSSCHKTPYDIKKPAVIGLKGALHDQCMGCHKENGIDNSCSTCHTKK